MPRLRFDVPAFRLVLHMRRTFVRFAVVLLPLILVACSKPEIATYRVPKDKTPAAAAAAPASPGPGTMAGTPVRAAAGAGLTWTGASHWQPKPASGMRKGTFTITGEGGATADLAITAFPGDVGGEVANVNRWRSQIQLPPLSPEEAARSIERLEYNGLKIGFVEMAGSGADATRVLGAMVPYEGATWFFKLTGPDTLVAKEKGAFLEFLRTLKPSGQ